MQAGTVVVETGEVNIGVAYAMMLLVWPEGERQDRVFTGIITYTIFNQLLVWLLTLWWARRRLTDFCDRLSARFTGVAAKRAEDRAEDAPAPGVQRAAASTAMDWGNVNSAGETMRV